MTNSRETAEQALARLQSALEKSEAERDLWKQTSSQLQDVASNERSKAKRLAEKLKVVESGSDRISRKEVNYWRKKAEKFEAARKEYQQRILELKAQLTERDEQDEETESVRSQNEELQRVQSLLAERETRITELSATIESSRLEREDFEQRIAQLDSEVRSLSQQVIDADNARNEACRAADILDAELKDLRAEASTHQQKLEALEQSVDRQTTIGEQYKSRIDELETQHEREIAALRNEHTKESAELTRQLDSGAQQTADLERRLSDERERSDNLNEIANEHREALAKTSEKLEEMEERYEDAKWHLGKARHFEILARRRRKLIGNLIQKIRERHKSNNALKAGLDSLRRYKANADERQQALLRRIEALENSLSEAREKLFQANQARRSTDPAEPGSSDATPQMATTGAEPSDLHSQVHAQAERIENLEAKLKAARVAESEALARYGEVARLQEELTTKSAFIGTLQREVEELEESVDELQEREFEVVKLRSLLDEREHQLNALQSDYNRLRAAKNGEVDSIDQQRIAELEEAIGKLNAKLREYESTITTLSEAADSWKRRYDFLAAETPYDLRSASSE